MVHTDRKISKGVTNMLIKYVNCTQENSFISHWQKNIERVTNMRLEYMDWTQEKILCHTDKNIEMVTDIKFAK